MSNPPVSRRAPDPNNNMGIAGFVVSIVGIVSCGLLSPVGLILSWIGMYREPKGLAIAGFVIGLIGSAWIILALIFGLFTMILAAAGIAASQNAP